MLPERAPRAVSTAPRADRQFAGTQPVPGRARARQRSSATRRAAARPAAPRLVDGQRDGRPSRCMRFEVDAYRRDTRTCSAAAPPTTCCARSAAPSRRSMQAHERRRRAFRRWRVPRARRRDGREAACHLREQIVGRIRSLSIHHPRSRRVASSPSSAGVAITACRRAIGHSDRARGRTQGVARARRASGGNCVKARRSTDGDRRRRLSVAADAARRAASSSLLRRDEALVSRLPLAAEAQLASVRRSASSAQLLLQQPGSARPASTRRVVAERDRAARSCRRPCARCRAARRPRAAARSGTGSSRDPAAGRSGRWSRPADRRVRSPTRTPEMRL